MLKTTASTGFAASLNKTESKAGGNNIVDNDEATNQTNPIKRKKQAKMTKSINLVKSKNHEFFLNSRNRKAGMSFLIPKARLTFT